MLAKLKSPALIRKLVLLAILFAFLAFAYGRQNAKDVALSEIEAHLLADAELYGMERCNDRDLIHFIEINPADTKGYFYYKGTDALSVDELVVIQGVANSELDAFRDLFEKRIENQKITFESYGPQQMATLNNAIIIAKGPYIIYYCGPEGDKVEEVFRHAL